jgi:hypothetical protein
VLRSPPAQGLVENFSVEIGGRIGAMYRDNVALELGELKQIGSGDGRRETAEVSNFLIDSDEGRWYSQIAAPIQRTKPIEWICIGTRSITTRVHFPIFGTSRSALRF